MTDYTATVDRYLAVWNEPDTDARTAAIAEIWAVDGHYTDPLSAVTGRADFGAMVAKVREMFPGHTFRRYGEVDGHHDTARFGWEMLSGTGDSTVVGFDVMALAPDGRIRAIYGFLDKVPAH